MRTSSPNPPKKIPLLSGCYNKSFGQAFKGLRCPETEPPVVARRRRNTLFVPNNQEGAGALLRGSRRPVYVPGEKHNSEAETKRIPMQSSAIAAQNKNTAAPILGRDGGFVKYGGKSAIFTLQKRIVL